MKCYWNLWARLLKKIIANTVLLADLSILTSNRREKCRFFPKKPQRLKYCHVIFFRWKKMRLWLRKEMSLNIEIDHGRKFQWQFWTVNILVQKTGCIALYPQGPLKPWWLKSNLCFSAEFDFRKRGMAIPIFCFVFFRLWKPRCWTICNVVSDKKFSIEYIPTSWKFPVDTCVKKIMPVVT